MRQMPHARLELGMFMCMQADPTILPDKKPSQSIMCYSHCALHNPGSWILHAEHVQTVFGVSREVLPHAFHLGSSGHRATKIFISVAPEKFGRTPSWLQSSKKRCILGLGLQCLPLPNDTQRAWYCNAKAFALAWKASSLQASLLSARAW